MANGVRSIGRMLGRKSEPAFVGVLREELLLFLATFFRHKGSLGSDEHHLVTKSIKALFRAKMQASENKMVDDFSWLFNYISDGILSINDEKELLVACSSLATKLAKVFKKHWKHFGDAASFFDCLK